MQEELIGQFVVVATSVVWPAASILFVGVFRKPVKLYEWFMARTSGSFAQNGCLFLIGLTLLCFGRHAQLPGGTWTIDSFDNPGTGVPLEWPRIRAVFGSPRYLAPSYLGRTSHASRWVHIQGLDVDEVFVEPPRPCIGRASPRLWFESPQDVSISYFYCCGCGSNEGSHTYHRRLSIPQRPRLYRAATQQPVAVALLVLAVVLPIVEFRRTRSRKRALARSALLCGLATLALAIGRHFAGSPLDLIEPVTWQSMEQIRPAPGENTPVGFSY